MTNLPTIRKQGDKKYILVKGEKIFVNDILKIVNAKRKKKAKKLTKSILLAYLKSVKKQLTTRKRKGETLLKLKGVKRGKAGAIGSKKTLAERKFEAEQERIRKQRELLLEAQKKELEAKEKKRKEEEDLKRAEADKKRQLENLRNDFLDKRAKNYGRSKKKRDEFDELVNDSGLKIPSAYKSRRDVLEYLLEKGYSEVDADFRLFLKKKGMEDEAEEEEGFMPPRPSSPLVEDIEEEEEILESKTQGDGGRRKRKPPMLDEYHNTPHATEEEIEEYLKILGEGNPLRIQAVLFDKDKYTLQEARNKLRKMKLHPMKHHITDKYIRFRINKPDKYDDLKTLKKDDMSIIVGTFKGSGKSEDINNVIWNKVAKANRQNKTNFLTDDKGKRLTAKGLKELYDKSRENKIKLAKMFSTFIPPIPERSLNNPEEQEEEIQQEDDQTIAQDVYEGDGFSGGDIMGALNNEEIDKIMKPVKSYIKTIPYDHMAYIPLKGGNNSFIINTDKSGNAGKHWIACYVDRNKKRFEFFDPFGYPPSHYNLDKPIHSFIKNKLDDGIYKLKYSTVKNQDPTTNGCGIHCIRYILDRESGKPFKKASKFLGSIDKNEDKVKQMREKFKYVI